MALCLPLALTKLNTAAVLTRYRQEVEGQWRVIGDVLFISQPPEFAEMLLNLAHAADGVYRPAFGNVMLVVPISRRPKL